MMRRMFYQATLLVALLLLGCFTLRERVPFYDSNQVFYAPAKDLGGWTTADPGDIGMDSDLLEKADTAMENVSGSNSLIVVRKGKIVWESYFNGAQEHFSENMHSIGKSILGALFGIAIKRGDIQGVSQKIYDHIQPSQSEPGWEQRSVKHLLTMSHGMKWIENQSESQIEKSLSWVDAIFAIPLVDSPGKEFTYSTGATHILSAFLTEATGVPTSEYAKKHLFEPLGITTERWGEGPEEYDCGGWNMYMIPRELAKLGQLFLNYGEWKNKVVVPAKWVEESWVPHYSVNSRYSYGYLWWLGRMAGHSVRFMWGWGGQYVYVVPSLKLVVVMTSNTTHGRPPLNGDKILTDYIIPAVNSVG